MPKKIIEQKSCYDNEKRLIMANEKMPESLATLEEFECTVCKFKCSKQSNWTTHISTKKHLNLMEKKLNKEKGVDSIYSCECGNEYKHMSSLCKHKKKCGVEKVVTPEPVPNADGAVSSDLFVKFMQQNKEMQNFFIEQNRELQNKVLELSKTKTVTNIQNNNIQNINNFNLNVFLNEQCKDAINITDFVESLKLEVADLEETGRLGYVLGISRIFINKLKELDVYERPLHCTDIKRETVYIKDKDAWEKDNTEKTTLKQAVKKIARKNLQQLPAWQEKNPDYVKLDTPENDEYRKISLNSLGSYAEEDEEKEVNRIMRNVLKEVVIDKK